MLCLTFINQQVVRHRIDGLETVDPEMTRVASVRHRIDGLESLFVVPK